MPERKLAAAYSSRRARSSSECGLTEKGSIVTRFLQLSHDEPGHTEAEAILLDGAEKHHNLERRRGGHAYSMIQLSVVLTTKETLLAPRWSNGSH